ncbi:MAG: hypothetical protein U0R17_06630 [Acidimicrobiia bacterium]
MRRFRRGATKGPSILRPGAGYGRLSFGAPGPTQSVEPREDLSPEMFFDNTVKTQAIDFARQKDGDTIIDLTNE